MLCAKCKQREATIHLTMIDGDKVKKVDFCEECAWPCVPGVGPNFRQAQFDRYMATGPHKWPLKGTLPKAIVEFIDREKPGVESMTPAPTEATRYPLEAYDFVAEALDISFEEPALSVRKLLDTLRELALQKFGKRAKVALAEWKILRTEDFGEIVLEMVGAGLLGKPAKECREEFKNRFDFDEAFPE